MYALQVSVLYLSSQRISFPVRVLTHAFVEHVASTILFSSFANIDHASHPWSTRSPLQVPHMRSDRS